MRVTVTITEGPSKGQVYTFDGHDFFLVGRSEQAHFQLTGKDMYFSRLHFLVEVNPPGCRLLDMNSRNGTYVNGQRVSAIDLHDGDQIKAGQTGMQVRIEEAGSVLELPEISEWESVPRQPPPLPVAAAVAAQPSQPPAAIPITPPPPPPPPPKRSHDAATAETLCMETLNPFAWQQSRSGSRPVASVPIVRTCPVCASPVPGAGLPGADDSWLCAACRRQAEERPQPIPGYRIVREIGAGTMGIVYHAVRRSDGMAAALKVIKPAGPVTPEDTQRFLREARILEQLRHPGIVAFYETGEVKGELYFAMEYVAGKDAWAILKKEGPMAIKRAVGLVCQILDALGHAHAKGFVHRDVKPPNVLVTQSAAGREVVKLADFGLARTYQSSSLSGLTMKGDMGGTIAFMPPEQITNYRNVKPAADQYAAAATLYTLLTNDFVFNLSLDGPAHLRRVAHLQMILQEEPVPIRNRRRDIPKGLAEATHRALAKDPAKRFPDVQALREALLPFAR